MAARLDQRLRDPARLISVSVETVVLKQSRAVQVGRKSSEMPQKLPSAIKAYSVTMAPCAE